MSEPVTLPREVVQAVFDAAVHSMDFGSGFLDDEEVTALRAVAVALGVDPMIATPDMFKCKYERKHGRWSNPVQVRDPRMPMNSVDQKGLYRWHCMRCHVSVETAERKEPSLETGFEQGTQP